MANVGKYYVYRHYVDDNTFYVGKGSGNRAYATGTHRSHKWHEFVNNNNKKYSIEIVKHFNDNEDALQFERQLTQHYKNLGQCIVNMSIGAKRDEKTKRKISQSISGEKHPFYNKTHSKVTKQKISKSHKGKILSNEHKKKISKALNGKNNPQAKQIEISINGIIYMKNCKKEMQKFLLNECNINASARFINGQIPKKYKDIVDYIKIENKIIYEKGEI